MKKSLLFLVFALISISAFTQNAMESKNSSVFVNFNELGISKEAFIKKFGYPIAKDLSYDKEGNKNEALYYIERVKNANVLIISTFVFKNDELVEQQSRFEYTEIKDLLDIIYRKVRWLD